MSDRNTNYVQTPQQMPQYKDITTLTLINVVLFSTIISLEVMLFIAYGIEIVRLSALYSFTEYQFNILVVITLFFVVVHAIFFFG